MNNPMYSKNTQLTDLWSRIARFSNYWTKYTSSELKISQKSNFKGKNFENSDEILILVSHGRIWSAFENICLFMQNNTEVTFHQWKYKVKQTKSSPKWKIYSHKPLYRPKKQKRGIFAARPSPRKRFEEIASQFSSRFIGPCGTRFSKILQ